MGTKLAKMCFFMAATSVFLAAPILAAGVSYLPQMPAGTGVFGIVVEVSPSFSTGYHYYDDPSTLFDEREVPEWYTMPSYMTGYTAGDFLDYHWVWVNGMYDHVTWSFTEAVDGVRVYPSQDHGPYGFGTYWSEFDEYDVRGSNDMVNWSYGTVLGQYCDDLNNVRTHDGVKDYRFSEPFKYFMLRATKDGDFEIDALEALPPSVVIVPIDIKPGSFPNSINLGSGGVVPVAVLSTETFDATTVDPLSVALADAAVAIRGKGTAMASFEDVNLDGRPDLVLQVSTEALNLTDADVGATLTGTTFGGTPIKGTDSVNIVP